MNCGRHARRGGVLSVRLPEPVTAGAPSGMPVRFGWCLRRQKQGEQADVGKRSALRPYSTYATLPLRFFPRPPRARMMQCFTRDNDLLVNADAFQSPPCVRERRIRASLHRASPRMGVGCHLFAGPVC